MILKYRHNIPKIVKHFYFKDDTNLPFVAGMLSSFGIYNYLQFKIGTPICAFLKNHSLIKVINIYF